MKKKRVASVKMRARYFIFLQILYEIKDELHESPEKDGLSIENKYKNRDMDVIPST